MLGSLRPHVARQALMRQACRALCGLSSRDVITKNQHSLQTFISGGQLVTALHFCKDEMLKKGVSPPIHLMTKLLSGLCASGRVEDACGVLPTLAASHSPTRGASPAQHDGCAMMAFATVIEHCLQQGQAKRAFTLLHQATELNVILDLPCCHGLLASVGPSTWATVEHIKAVLDHIRNTGLAPTETTYKHAIAAALRLRDYMYIRDLLQATKETGVELSMDTWLVLYFSTDRALRFAQYRSDEHQMMQEIKRIARQTLRIISLQAHVKDLERLITVCDGVLRAIRTRDGGEEDEEDGEEDDIVSSQAPTAVGVVDEGDDDEDDEDDDHDDDDDDDDHDRWEDSNEEEEEDERAAAERRETYLAIRHALPSLGPLAIDGELPSSEGRSQALPALPWGPIPFRSQSVLVVDPTRYVGDEEEEEGTSEEGAIFEEPEEEDVLDRVREMVETGVVRGVVQRDRVILDDDDDGEEGDDDFMLADRLFEVRDLTSAAGASHEEQEENPNGPMEFRTALFRREDEEVSLHEISPFLRDCIRMLGPRPNDGGGVLNRLVPAPPNDDTSE